MIKRFIVGIDEVGRGPIAGPVTVCAFKISENIYKKLKTENFFRGLKDSKKLSAKQRQFWFEKISSLKKTLKKGEVDFVIYSASAQMIDQKGITWCISNLIKKNLEKVSAKETDIILLDGLLKAPTHFQRQKTIIKGDEIITVISCASILAKITRDHYMKKMSVKFPDYGFERHVGYGTKAHLQAVKERGLCPIHRQSYILANY